MLTTPDAASFTMPLMVTVTSVPSGGHSTRGDAALVIVGPMVSGVTVTVNVVLAELGGVAESLAEQVTVVVPTNVLPEAGEHETGLGPEMASIAIGVGYVTTAPLALPKTVMSPGVPAIAGATVSRTVTVNDASPVLLPSLAAQVTVVTPIGNVAPDTGEHVGLVTPAIESVAEAEKVTTAPAALAASVTIFAGTVTIGAVVSATTTSNVPVAWLPDESVAVHVTGVLPIGNAVPEGLSQTTLNAPSASSIAVTA